MLFSKALTCFVVFYTQGVFVRIFSHRSKPPYPWLARWRGQVKMGLALSLLELPAASDGVLCAPVAIMEGP